MKNKHFGIIALLFLLTPFALSVGPISKYQLSSSIYGPFKQHDDNPNLQINISSSSLINQEVYILFKITDDNNTVVAQSKSTNTVISKYQNGKVNINLLTQAYLDVYGMNILFFLIDSSNSNNLLSSSFKVYPIKGNTYNPIEYSQSHIFEYSTSFKFANSGVIIYQEKYIFNDFFDYFLIDTYYRLLISQYYFSYQYINSLTYRNAYLILPDSFNNFSYIEIDDNGQIVVPLSLIKESEKYSLSFPSTMYVNPNTLEMSLTKISGFSITPYFYLPINHLNDLSESTFTFVIEGLGCSQSNFIWKASYLVYQGLIGPCNNSDYCIVGGIVS